MSVPEQELARYDEREIPSKYKRIELPVANVNLLNNKSSSGTFWTYVAIDPKDPDAEHPIPQSYIDVVLTGFLDFGTDFAKEFVDSTEGWKYIVNDRDNPLYSRALKNVERRAEIDTLLSKASLVS